MKEKFDIANFYKRHQSEALRYAVTCINNMEDARDVVSDAWVRLLETKEHLDDEKNVNGLFFSIVRSKCVDYLRRRKCKYNYERWMMQTADRISDEELSALYQKELFRILGSTLSKMTKLRQTVFMEVRLDGKTYPEAAKQMHVSKRVVEYQLKKAEDSVFSTLRRMYG